MLWLSLLAPGDVIAGGPVGGSKATGMGTAFVAIADDPQVTDRFSLRTGYVYAQSPVPERTLDPGNPDSDHHDISIGFGYKMNRLTLDAFYQAEIYRKRQVQNSILSGEYESLTHLIGFSLGYRY